MATEFFTTLYTANLGTRASPDSWSFPSISHGDKRWLNRGVTTVEVKLVLFHMDGRKTPGPDGISAGFLQQYWHIVADSLVDFIKRAFLTSSFPADMNLTFISLIPK